MINVKIKVFIVVVVFEGRQTSLRPISQIIGYLHTNNLEGTALQLRGTTWILGWNVVLNTNKNTLYSSLHPRLWVWFPGEPCQTNHWAFQPSSKQDDRSTWSNVLWDQDNDDGCDSLPQITFFFLLFFVKNIWHFI